jgi:hypothetical protein
MSSAGWQAKPIVWVVTLEDRIVGVHTDRAAAIQAMADEMTQEYHETQPNIEETRHEDESIEYRIGEQTIGWIEPGAFERRLTDRRVSDAALDPDRFVGRD